MLRINCVSLLFFASKSFVKLNYNLIFFEFLSFDLFNKASFTTLVSATTENVSSNLKHNSLNIHNLMLSKRLI